MTIHSNSSLVPNVLPGIAHRTLAGREHGLRRLAVWSQRLDPQGATPPHTHDCEEVVVVQSGQGTVLYGGQEHAVRAGDVIIVPPNAPHQILNTGDEPLVTFAALSTADVEVKLPDGTRIDLPWE